MTLRGCAGALLVPLAVACSRPEEPEPVPLAAEPVRHVEFDESKILALAADFAIHKGLTEACDGDDPDHLSTFFGEIVAMGASDALIESTRLVATEMYDMARKEEPEYVCTPEMFEGVNARVAAARLDWVDIRESVE